MKSVTAAFAATSGCFLFAAMLTAGEPREGGRGGRPGASGERPGPAPAAKDDAEKKILDRLKEVEGQLRGNRELPGLNVPEWDGRVLRLLAEAIGAKQVVEIGTSNGYSGLWLCLALRTTGGKLTTFDIDEKKVQLAQENFKKAGVDGIVTVVLGDAHEKLAEVKEPVDLVFIDAEKEGYVRYLEQVLPLVRPGGLILAHNIPREKRGDGRSQVLENFIDAAAKNPALETLLLMGGGGMSVTMKKR